MTWQIWPSDCCLPQLTGVKHLHVTFKDSNSKSELQKYTFSLSTDHQIGFKRKHGTDLCIFALKEILDKYNSTLFTAVYCPPVVSNKVALENLQWLIMTAWGCCWEAPRSSSASHMFVSVGVPTCSAVLRNPMYRFMCRASESENNLIAVLANPVRSSVRFSSRLWNHWRTCLYARHWILWKALYFLLCLSVDVVCTDMDPPGSEINNYIT